MTPLHLQAGPADEHVEAALWRALDDGHLELVYQPVVDLNDASIGGVEALLRWRRDGAMVTAGAFLPAVRDALLFDAISAFVFQEAAQQAATWRRRFESWLFPVSVNVAPADFTDVLVARVSSLRSAHGLPHGALALEVSEPLLLHEPDVSRPRIAALKDAGAQIVVDDFGVTHGAMEPTGDELMQSVQALEPFSIDVVKVDRTLIDRSLAHPHEAAILAAVVKLAHVFGFRVLAEGVESGDEAERLRRSGYDLGQGYYFQRPHGPGHIDRLLHDLASAREAFTTPPGRKLPVR
jgi:EAL domain-containing protein (putative c-di-GMP-specific phosphodiesterase class I)